MTTLLAGWTEVVLGDICEFRYGKSLPAAKRSGSGYPVFGSNGQVGAHSTTVTKAPAIVIGRKGSFGEVHWSDQPCWPIDTTYFVDAAATDADLRWLFHRLRCLGLTELNRAAAIPGLNREDAYRKKLLLPPLEEQRRIAAILDKADQLRAKRRAALEHLDSLTQAIFFDMFGDPVVNPKGWPLVAIGDLGEVVTGNTPPRANASLYGDFVEWVKSDNIDRRLPFVTTASERLSEAGVSSGRTAPPGSVLITCIAGSPNSIGNAAATDRTVAFNQQINAVVLFDNVDWRFALTLFRSAKRLVQAASTGGMKGLVSKSRLQQVTVPLPPEALQNRFGEAWTSADRIRRGQQASARSTEDLFAALQSQAFRGEL